MSLLQSDSFTSLSTMDSLPVVITGPAWTLKPNGQGVNALQIKATAGVLQAIEVCSRNASTRYIWVYDNPAATGTVLGVFMLYANGINEIGSEYWGVAGTAFANGCYVAVSTSNTSLVLATASDHDISGVAN